VEKLLKIDEAAEKLGLKKSTLYKYTSAKKVPYVKIGARVLFPEDCLNRWVNACMVEPVKAEVHR